MIEHRTVTLSPAPRDTRALNDRVILEGALSSGVTMKDSGVIGWVRVIG